MAGTVTDAMTESDGTIIVINREGILCDKESVRNVSLTPSFFF